MAQVAEERGEARGEARGLRRALAAVLAERFGELEPWVPAALAAADLDTLDAWLRKAATAPTIADVGIARETPPR